jgi:ribosomal protein S12 methylthiotransferase accessory factor
MDLIITFPGGRKVDAEYKGQTIHTDQPVQAGGEGSAPSPFDYFLASIGTCSGIYVVDFCQNRGIPLDGIRIVQRMERDPEKKMISLIKLDIEVPPGFPEKYKSSLIRVVDLCTVKKHMLDPPEFAIQIVEKS